MTRKARRTSSTLITWEQWWARNRYQFLNFPSISDEADRSFPLTRSLKGISSKSGRIAALRLKSLALIRPMLDHESARLRRSAVTGLAMLNDHDALPSIVGRLKDGNQTVRDSALLALGILDNSEARHLLLHMARGSESACKAIDQTQVPDYFRGFAEVSLALEEVRGIGALLRSIVYDTKVQQQVQAMALEGIGLVGGEDSSKFLMEYIDEAKAAPTLLGTATAALGKTRAPLAVPFLRQCLFSKHMPVRQSAAIALGSVAAPKDTEMVKHLYRCFKHTNDQALKGFSLISMGRIGGAEAVKSLETVIRRGLDSERPWACLSLGFALRDAKDPDALKHLVKHAISDANRSTRGAAVIGLGLAGYSEDLDPLVKILKDGDDPIYRGHTALALGMIGNQSAIDPLKQLLLEDELPAVKMQAAMALALMNDTSTVSEMIDLLMTTPNDTLKGFISLSLSYMASVTTVEEIQDAMVRHNDLDDLTLAHFVHLTSKLLSGRLEPYLDRLAAGSNFACEYPLVQYLLGFGI